MPWVTQGRYLFGSDTPVWRADGKRLAAAADSYYAHAYSAAAKSMDLVLKSRLCYMWFVVYLCMQCFIAICADPYLLKYDLKIARYM